ncbi:hypothetical protein [Pseudoclavibacter endophyticus]|uniref:LPXTG cell wall anchor domain-containing protein n=1 Tax=Pseudoclavibacter endophyticus TaxID=1778590 RepID=A0A6H9WMX1_9MICO|nr:hypothetical protein [Pseudoclavibacter endophyticus]KAB1648108.1 hypothetical protein F8O04_10310 [Pseudoclavibacter endophyticus]
MTASTSPIRRRVAAASLAFAVVSGGAFLSATPAFATGPTDPTTDAPTPTETTEAPVLAPAVQADATELTPEDFAANGITFAGSGFDPVGDPVVVNVAAAGDSADLPAEATVAEDGTFGYTVTFEDEGLPVEGTYTFTFTQGEGEGALSASVDVVVAAAGETTTPTYEGPIGNATQEVFAPGDVVTYTLANFTPSAEAEVAITGPIDGSLPITIGEDGTYAGEITYNEYDAVTGDIIRRLDFPVGEYTVTVTEAGTGNTVTFTFTIAGESAGEGEAPQAGDDSSLAPTGSDDVFGIAGLGLLVVGFGVGALALNRRLAARRAE